MRRRLRKHHVELVGVTKPISNSTGKQLTYFLGRILRPRNYALKSHYCFFHILFAHCPM